MKLGSRAKQNKKKLAAFKTPIVASWYQFIPVFARSEVLEDMEDSKVKQYKQ